MLQDLLFNMEEKMTYYTLKSHKAHDYLIVEKETQSGYVVRIIRDKDGYEEITKDIMSKDLFETCIRTGYIQKVTENVLASQSA